ncbi:hypothetical protein ACX8XN_04350 [Calditrichota bacterium GD2]
MPSKKVYDAFLEKGYPVDRTEYNRLDALESNDDLEHLFTVLVRHKDSNGRPPIITANTIVANPDFDQIRESGFQTYHYEHFSKTLERYPKHNMVIDLYRQGMDDRLFHPQFHGREHLNVHRWMKALQSGSEDLAFTFSHRTTYSGREDYNYMEALDYDSPFELESHKRILIDGLRIFRETFGFESKSFIASCYTWHSEVEKTLAENGVKYMQGGRWQNIPTGSFGHYKTKYHYIGQKNTNGLTFLVRNALFEPALIQKSDWVGYTLNNIATAFRWYKPAIISSHRINFIGYLDEQNRIRNLKLFDELLHSILKKWPDVEFMTSDELGELMNR